MNDVLEWRVNILCVYVLPPSGFVFSHRNGSDGNLSDIDVNFLCQ